MVFIKLVILPQKSFKTIFFPQKKEIVSALDDFENKTGLWHPDCERACKLVILLAGEAGTGKTSCIKAIANQTKRHLFICNLSNIKSDEQLSRLFRNRTIMVTENGLHRVAEEVEPAKRIYVMEDLDCAGEADWLFKRADDDDDDNERKSHSKNWLTSSSSMSFGHFAPMGAISGPSDAIGKCDLSSSSKTLSGMLNLLDGIIELQGQIVIFTTNKSALFDPALFRSGRVDVRVDMTFIKYSEVIMFLEHLYRPNLVSSNAKADLQAALRASQWTAADIQQWCQPARCLDEAISIILNQPLVPLHRRPKNRIRHKQDTNQSSTIKVLPPPISRERAWSE